VFSEIVNGMEYCHVSLMIVALSTPEILNLAVAVVCNVVQLVEHVALCFSLELILVDFCWFVSGLLPAVRSL